MRLWTQETIVRTERVCETLQARQSALRESDRVLIDQFLAQRANLKERITALLPAFAAAVSAFRSLYQWQRQASIYEDTWLALQQARLAMPDEDYLEPGDYTRYFPQLVYQTEEVLRREASQWGQMEQISGAAEEKPSGQPSGAG